MFSGSQAFPDVATEGREGDACVRDNTSNITLTETVNHTRWHFNIYLKEKENGTGDKGIRSGDKRNRNGK